MPRRAPLRRPGHHAASALRHGLRTGLPLLVLVTGCASDPVEVTPAEPVGDAMTACRALHRALPEEVEGQERRETSPETTTTAAWGDPAITLRCGVPRPGALELTSELVVVEDVDWFAEERRDGYVFTTTSRVARVEVTVPDDYAPEVNPLVDLADAVRRTVPLREDGAL